MKSVCSVHEQAYDVGSRCPYCEVPEADATDRDWAVTGIDQDTGTVTYGLIPAEQVLPIWNWTSGWASVMAGIRDDK